MNIHDILLKHLVTLGCSATLAEQAINILTTEELAQTKRERTAAEQAILNQVQQFFLEKQATDESRLP